MGSIQCALVGYGIFKLPGFRASPGQRPFGALENVVVQTVGVATAAMPLAAGFVGIIPALGMLDPPVRLGVGAQLAWAGALAYFGIFFAVPLRRQVVLIEQLPFPSGTATAKLIELLHARRGPVLERTDRQELGGRWRALGLSFAASFGLGLLAFCAPAAANVDVLAALGWRAPGQWGWTLRPALSYVGQGMIMRHRAGLSMLAGAVVAWGVLGPYARRVGWASGPIDSWQDGAQGWLLWVAIGLMLAEALSSFALIAARQLSPLLSSKPPPAADPSPGGGTLRAAAAAAVDEHEVAPEAERVPNSWWAGGLLGATSLCVGALSALFAIAAWQLALAVVFSCLIAVLAVRALGQTDLNPVSAVGKLSQIAFAVLAPGHIVANIVAGALAEAGAMQAGELLQDLKAGHLLGASPRAQFYAQLIGSTASIFVTVAAYQCYDAAYGIPSAEFKAPVAHVWKDMAELMLNGIAALPPSALRFATAFGAVGAALPVLEAALPHAAAAYLPSGIAFGVGMYLTPDWTLPRVAGALVEWAWARRAPSSHRKYMLMVASGFVLGEGVWSIAQLALKAAIKAV